MAECTCASAAHKHFFLVLCCGGFFVSVSPAQCDEAWRVDVQYMVPLVSVSGKGGAMSLVLIDLFSKPLQKSWDFHNKKPRHGPNLR